ncbi:cytoplasmic protein, partial [Bacillus pseudomycoides]
PAFKWMPFNIERMKIKPANLYERMTNILIGHPENSINELELLIKEVLVLAGKQISELDLCEQRKQISYAK